MKAHDFVCAGGRNVFFDPNHAIGLQILDKLSARRLILDQDGRRLVKLSQVLDRSLEIGIVQAFTRDMQKVSTLILVAPCRAHTVIV